MMDTYPFFILVGIVFSLPLCMGRFASAEEPPIFPELRTEAREERDAELLYLKEETVSIAARHEQPISEAPSNVYVITDSDIRHSGATDLPTVLRRIPGLEVMQVTGATFNVSMRGNNQLSANKLLVMVDGRSIYTDSQGSIYWKALPVTLPEIKRIEVQKGPASVLYGFNAFDGIINIITKSPEDMKGATVQVGGGELGTLTSAAVYANSHQKFSYRLSYGHDQYQQWRDRSAAAYRDNKFNLQSTYTLGRDSKVLFSGGLVEVNRFDGLVSDVSVGTQLPTFGYAQTSYERPNFSVRAFWNSYHIGGATVINPLLAPFIQPVDRDSQPNLNVHGHTYNLEAEQQIEVAPTTRLTAGINYRHNTISSNHLDRFRTEDRVGLYLQGEWKPSPLFQLVGGARYDLDTFIHPTISPRGSFIFTPVPNHTIRATVALGYRPPTLFETYIEVHSILTFPPPNPSPLLAIARGNGRLRPEQIISYELEYQGWYLQHRARIRTSLFYNHLSDLITLTGTTPVQGGVADIYGGEAGIDFVATTWLTGFGNIAYQECGQSLTGSTRRAVPRFKYNAGLRGQWENGLSGEIAYHWVGASTFLLGQGFVDFQAFGVIPPDTYVGSYHLLNLRGAYRFWQEETTAGYRREAEVAVSVFNALNDQHREHPLGDLLGSRALGWLTIRY